MRKLATTLALAMWILSAMTAQAQSLFLEITNKNVLGSQGVIVVPPGMAFTPPSEWMGHEVHVFNGRQGETPQQLVRSHNIAYPVVYVWKGGGSPSSTQQEYEIHWQVIKEGTQLGSSTFPVMIMYDIPVQGQVTLTPHTPLGIKGFLERVDSPASTEQIVALPVNWRPEPCPEPPSGMNLPWVAFWLLLVFAIIGAVGTFLIAKDRYGLWKMRREDPWRY